ncbi:MAG: IPT/TIG domain-containing protein [Candidatus Kerfeldbacteria bacterium]|nr:IPT/TIG domain-containing protein [Candidatus Kerfeldbacteria bacterium]
MPQPQTSVQARTSVVLSLSIKAFVAATGIVAVSSIAASVFLLSKQSPPVTFQNLPEIPANVQLASSFTNLQKNPEPKGATESSEHLRDDMAPYHLSVSGTQKSGTSRESMHIEAVLESALDVTGTVDISPPDGVRVAGRSSQTVHGSAGSTQTFQWELLSDASFSSGEMIVVAAFADAFHLSTPRTLRRTENVLQIDPLPSLAALSLDGVRVSKTDAVILTTETRKPSGGQVNTDGTTTVKGAFLYEDQPFNKNGFTGIANRPIREADIRIWDQADGTLLAQLATSTEGTFTTTFEDDKTRNLVVRVLTTSDQQPEHLHGSVATVAGLPYAMDVVFEGHLPGQPIDFSATPVVATKDAAGRPFNMFDVIKDVEDYLDLVGESETAGELLTIHWEEGLSYGKYYDMNGGVWLPGYIGSDDDSYDDTVILHEVGHYVTDQYSRFEDFFGSHGFYDQFDIRLSYTEGIATYLSSAVRAYKGRTQPSYYQDPAFYIETNGQQLSWYGCFGDPICTYNGYAPSRKDLGAGNEVPVGAALYDIVDSQATQDGSVGQDDDALQFSSPEGDRYAWQVFRDIQATFPMRDKKISLESFWDSWQRLDLPNSDEVNAAFQNVEVGYAQDESEPNDTFANATPVEVNTSTQHTLYVENDEDVFSIELTAGTDYIFSAAELLDGSDPILELYTSAQELISSSDDAPYRQVYTRDGFSPSIVFSPDSSDSYFLKLYRYAEAAPPLLGTYGTYTLFIDENPLTLTNVQPTTGANFGGERVRIRGNGFVDGIKVWFGEYEGTNVNVLDPQTITVLTPRNVVGPVDVRVQYPQNAGYAWASTIPSAFTFSGSPLAPEITGATVAHGPVGRDVVLKGNFFYGKPKVFFGNQLLPSRLLSSREIGIRVPSISTGVYTVRVENPDHQQASRKDFFEVSQELRQDVNAPITSGQEITSTLEVADDIPLSSLSVYVDYAYYSSQNVRITLTSPQGTVIEVLNHVPIAKEYACGKGCTQDWIEGITGYVGADIQESESFVAHAGSQSFETIKEENAKGTWTVRFAAYYGGTRGDKIFRSWGIEFLSHQERPSNGVVLTANEYRHSVIALDPVTEKPIYQTVLRDCDAEGYGCYSAAYMEDVTISPDVSQAWAAPHWGKGIAVIQPFSGKLLRHIQLFHGDYGYMDIQPGGIQFTPDGSKVFVQRGYDADEIRVFSGATFEQIGRIDTAGVALAATNKKLYVLEDAEALIRVYDVDTFLLLKEISTFSSPRAVAISSRGRLVVAHDQPNRISQYDTTTDTLIDEFSTATDGPPSGVVLNTEETKAYVTLGQWYAGLNIFDLVSKTGKTTDLGNEVLTTYNTPTRLLSGEILIGNWYGDELYVLDPVSDEVVREFEQGSDPGYYIRDLDATSTSRPGLRVTPKSLY